MYIMYIFEIMIPTKSKSVGESRTRAVLWSGCGSSGNHPDANRGGRRIRSVWGTVEAPKMVEFHLDLDGEVELSCDCFKMF